MGQGKWKKLAFGLSPKLLLRFSPPPPPPPPPPALPPRGITDEKQTGCSSCQGLFKPFQHNQFPEIHESFNQYITASVKCGSIHTHTHGSEAPSYFFLQRSNWAVFCLLYLIQVAREYVLLMYVFFSRLRANCQLGR